MMRAWILPRGADADGGPQPWRSLPGYLSGAEWVDGTGDVADTCTVTLNGLDDGDDVDLLLSGRLSLLLAPPAGPTVADLLCYGPYDVDPAAVHGENRTWSITGRIGSHFEATIADHADEARLYAALEAAITDALTATEPWRGWATGAGAPSGAAAIDYVVSPAFIWGQIQSQLVNARDLAGVRQILAQWGLTATPYPANITPTAFRHRVRVEPLYRPATTGFTPAAGNTVRLTTLGAPAQFGAAAAASSLSLMQDHLDAHPSIDWPDGLNRPGNYEIRQISGVNRRFGDSIEDNHILSAGTLRPPVYVEADNGPNLLKQREEVERWRLQNESALLTAVRRFESSYADVARAFVTPYQLAILGRRQLPPGSHGAVWQVRQVNHAWNETEGYQQEIKASLWQGPFFRTSGNAVRQQSL